MKKRADELLAGEAIRVQHMNLRILATEQPGLDGPGSVTLTTQVRGWDGDPDTWTTDGATMFELL